MKWHHVAAIVAVMLFVKTLVVEEGLASGVVSFPLVSFNSIIQVISINNLE